MDTHTHRYTDSSKTECFQSITQSFDLFKVVNDGHTHTQRYTDSSKTECFQSITQSFNLFTVVNVGHTHRYTDSSKTECFQSITQSFNLFTVVNDGHTHTDTQIAQKPNAFTQSLNHSICLQRHNSSVEITSQRRRGKPQDQLTDESLEYGKTVQCR